MSFKTLLFSTIEDEGDETLMFVRLPSGASGLPDQYYDLWAGGVDDGRRTIKLTDGLEVEVSVGRRHDINRPNSVDYVMPGVVFRLIEDDSPTGVACISFHNEDLDTYGPTIRTLEIKEAYQRAGRGSRLLSQIEEFFLGSGFADIYGWNSNAAGAAFMEANGYTCEDDDLRENWSKSLI